MINNKIDRVIQNLDKLYNQALNEFVRNLSSSTTEKEFYKILYSEDNLYSKLVKLKDNHV